MSINKVFFPSLFCVLMTFSAYAQRVNTTNNNFWFIYNGDHKFSKKMGLHIEIQERRSDWGQNNQQHLFRTGINYHFLPNASATLGYAFVKTYPYGEFAVKNTFPEHRIYEQLQYSNFLERVELVSRFRLEQRFSYLPILSNDGTYTHRLSPTYTNRFRFLQRFSIPLMGQKIEDKSLFISTYDEFFINFGKKVQNNIFDQNRAFMGIGYKIPKIGRIEAGYLHQLLFKGDGIKVENNHTLQISLNANFELRDVSKVRH